MKNKDLKFWILGVAVLSIVLFAASIILAQNQANSIFDKMMVHCGQMMGEDVNKIMDSTIPPKPEGMSMEEHLSHHPELNK